MDSKFVSKLVSEFFEIDGIKEKILAIEELCESSGKKAHDYEKWLQIEFAIFLHKRDNNDIHDWGREKKYSLDGRRKIRIKQKESTTVDFWFKRKNQKKSGEILVEFKRARSINGCVKKMIKDGALLRKIKKSQSEVRSFWMIGFHPSENESHNVFEKAFNQEAKLNEWVRYKDIKTETIGGTNLSYSIFTLDEA
ncbi:hypothetical protein [Shewanella sp.]|uniref:hypothetical protein n=1 Tax=Shewanella sp. TaxID=50422 RepID=UPI003563DD65